jgi:hypothetical protein
MSDGSETRAHNDRPHPLPRYHVLAIVSFILSLTGYSFLPFLGSVGAIVTGKMATADMYAHPGEYRGELLARLGIWLGWLALILAAAIFIAALALLFVISTSSMVYSRGL